MRKSKRRGTENSIIQDKKILSAEKQETLIVAVIIIATFVTLFGMYVWDSTHSNPVHSLPEVTSPGTVTVSHM